MIDLWLPPKPAIIRPASKELVAYGLGGRARKASILPGHFPAAAAVVKPPFEATTVGVGSANINASSATFNSSPFGAVAPANSVRYIAVGVSGAQSGPITITGVTIGGITATAIVQRSVTNIPCGIFYAAVPTGTTGTIFIQFNNTTVTCGVVIVRLLNPALPGGFANASADHSSGVLNLNLNIPGGGFAMAIAATQNGSSTTWTGLTEQLDVDQNTGEFLTGATGGSPGTPATVTATNATTTPTAFQGVAASWGPQI